METKTTFDQAMEETMSQNVEAKPEGTVVIKRYPNRKLYDTNASHYVTLDDIRALVKVGQEIVVIDNKTKQDLTALTLLQVMFDDQRKKIVDGHVNAPNVETLTQAVRMM